MSGGRLSVALLLGALPSCSGPPSDPASVDAGSTASPLDLRRALRGEPVAIAPASSKPASLPFVDSVAVPLFGPSSLTSEPSLVVPGATPSGPATILLSAPIAPMPDRSGRFVMRRRESSTFFTSRGFALSLAGGTKDAPRAWGLHATLVGGREVQPIAEKQQHAFLNHYVGEPANWQTDIPTYGQLAWEEVYAAVDMVVEPVRGGFAYRFVLSPGARVSDVVMRWEGATGLRIVDDGRGVDVLTDVGTLRLRDLRAFAAEGKHRTELAARHVLVRDNEIGLRVEGWDQSVPLVIDPTVSWSSFLGGNGAETRAAVATDFAGNALLTGQTRSVEFPTLGAFDTTYGGDTTIDDAFVTKLSRTGTLLWSSYLGGASDDFGASIATDGSGNAFVVGNTRSTDFPSTGGFDTSLGGTRDAFLTKLSGAGALLWSTYLGGSSGDEAEGVAVDGSGNPYLTGVTYSADFPTPGGFDKLLDPPTPDAFVTKVSGTGALLWSSYLGGGNTDVGHGIAVDGSGNAYVTGYTESANFPRTGGFDTTHGGLRDAFVTKVSSSGTLVWSTFLGGASSEDGYGIAIDGSGNAFVTGHTSSVAFPTVGGFDTSVSGVTDAFITKLSSSGALVWSTLLGGTLWDQGSAIAVDGAGNAYVSGATQSTDFPTSGGFDTTAGGNYDAFVTKVSGSGALLWSSYLAGTSADHGQGIAVEAFGNVYVSGYTQSADFPSPGGFDTSKGGTYDAFVTRITVLPNGSACLSPAACRSDFCTDGVCCDKACAGLCEACSAAKKGSGTNGVCGFVRDAMDPDRECTAQSCTGGVVTRAQVCNGAGACRANGTLSCGLYASCVGASCTTTCSGDGDCVASAWCSGATCVADLDLAATCARDAQCKSGFCADGVCCDKSCDGPCEACSAVKKGSGVDGTCAPVAVDTDPKDACAASTGICGADGLCDGAGNCRPFAKAGTACGETAVSCTDGVISGKVCKGDSAECVAVAPCGGFACASPTSCKSSCASAADCAPGYACTEGKCGPTAAPECSADGATVLDKDKGTTTQCSPYRCDPTSRACKGACASETDCLAGFVCNSAQRCEPQSQPTGQSGGCSCETTPRAGVRAGATWVAALLATALVSRRARGRGGKRS